MDLTLAQGVALVVEATEAETQVMGEGSLDMVEEIQVMGVGILAFLIIDQVSDVRMGHLHSDLTTTALAPPILVLNASIQYHNILLVWRRSSQVANWPLQA